MKRLMITIFSIAALVGCANSDLYSGDVYTGSQAKEIQTVTYGTVLSMRPITIQAGSGNDNAFGAIAGGVLGGLLGNTVGGGSGKKLTTAAAAVAGSIAGSTIDQKLSQTNGLELEIRTDSGQNIVVVQKASPGQFRVGMRVRIANSGKRATVSPM